MGGSKLVGTRVGTLGLLAHLSDGVSTGVALHSSNHDNSFAVGAILVEHTKITGLMSVDVFAIAWADK